MKRKRFLIIMAVAFVLAFAVTAFGEAPELVPSELIPPGAGELVGVSTVGSSVADYLILYTYKDPYGRLVTYAFQVGGGRVSGASGLKVRLSHIIRP